MNLAYLILMKNSKQLNLSQLFLYPISGVVAESILYSPFFVFSWEFMEQSIPMKMRTSLCYERPFWKDFVELKELFLCIANKCIMWCTSIIYFCALPTNAILHLEHYKSCLFRWALFRQYFFFEFEDYRPIHYFKSNPELLSMKTGYWWAGCFTEQIQREGTFDSKCCFKMVFSLPSITEFFLW